MRHFLSKLKEDGLLGGGLALDLGFGAGREALLLARDSYEVDAVDSDPSAVEKLKKESAGLNINIFNQDMESFVIFPDRYSIVMANNSLPFISSKESAKKIISDMVAGLVKGGNLHVTLFGPRAMEGWGSRKNSMSFFEFDEGTALMESLGLKLYYKITEEGWGKSGRGIRMYWHIHTYMYVRE